MLVPLDQVVGRPQEDGGFGAAVQAGQELGAGLEEAALPLTELAGDGQCLLVMGLSLGIVPHVKCHSAEVGDPCLLVVAVAELAGDGQSLFEPAPSLGPVTQIGGHFTQAADPEAFVAAVSDSRVMARASW